MTEYAYIAKGKRGESLEGRVEASSKNTATSQLRNRGWVVISVQLVNSERTTDPAPGTLPSLGRWIPVRSVQLEVSLQQLALMVRSGMTLLASIDSCAKQAPSIQLQNVWAGVGRDIQSGKGLSHALAQQNCFPDFVVKLVHVGEKTGNLENVLRRSSESMKNRRLAREEFWSATIYPAIVTLLAILVTAYMVVYLIPKLDLYLQSLGKQMPAMTQSLINLTGWLTDYFLAICVGLISAAIIVAVIYASKEGRRLIDRGLLRVPVIGRLISLVETTTFARSLSMMLASGITLTEGLGTTRGLIQNRHLALLVESAKEKIMRGSNLAEALDDSVGFSPMLSQMIIVGQQSGELETVLGEVALLHEDQFRTLIKRLNSMLTPVLTVIIGGIVGYVYVAFFIALFAAGS